MDICRPSQTFQGDFIAMTERQRGFGWNRQPQGKQASPCQATTEQPYRLAPRECPGSSHAFERKAQRLLFFCISVGGDKLPPFLVVPAVIRESLHSSSFLPLQLKRVIPFYYDHDATSLSPGRTSQNSTSTHSGE